MTEEFDVFGDLDALCDVNLLAKFKSSVPSIELSKSNDDVDDIFEIESSIQTKVNNKNSSTLNDELISPNLATTSKKKSPLKRTRALAKGVSPTKIRSPKKDSVGSVEDSSAIKTVKEFSNDVVTSAQHLPILQNTTSKPKRQTRSMSKNGSSIPTMRSNVSVVPATTATTATIQQPNTVSRRGRKKRQQNQNQNTLDIINMPQIDSAHAPNSILRHLNRRSIAAARASLCTQVDYVDLVSSPVPRINGVINVDSDAEDFDTASTSLTKTNSLDLSFDEENPEISVKVIWNGNPEVFKLRKHQKLAYIFNVIALREKTEERNLVFNLNNKILSPEDTPASIDYKIFQFINGRILMSKFDSPVVPVRRKRDANKISLKIQSDKWKKPLQIELLRTDNFKVLYIKCAEELNIPYENFKLSFDGEPLELGDTPASLELEGGEAIDLRIRN